MVNANGVYGTSKVFAGYATDGSVIYINGASSVTGEDKFRNIQRYDITSYQNGKDIIDGLMT